jgi:hypothetical protein
MTGGTRRTNSNNFVVNKFAEWLEEVFAEVRTSARRIWPSSSSGGGVLKLTPFTEKTGSSSRFSVVVWGVKVSFYTNVIEPRVRELPDCDYGYSRERFWFTCSNCPRLFSVYPGQDLICERIDAQDVIEVDPEVPDD